MAYTVVLERENNPDPIRWKWYVEANDGFRTIRFDEGAAPTAEIAAEECQIAYEQKAQR